jgi:predicted N-acetyltransferase YhbS
MNILCRQETPSDYSMVEELVEAAFENAPHADHDEHKLVARLRKSEAFIPRLSLVAMLDGKIVGHVMLTKLIIDDSEKNHVSLTLAPVSVLPEFQRKGIGGKLVLSSLEIAQQIGYSSVVVLGHPEYYPRFGFTPASLWGIKSPFEVPDEAFMAKELIDDGLDGVSGTVEYSPAFFG